MTDSQELNELSETATHVVVCFTQERRADKKTCIDLVPANWVNKIQLYWYCYYPPKSDYKKVEKWAENSYPPRGDWEQFPIQILKEAFNYTQGRRRLRRISDGNIVLSSEASDDDREKTNSDCSDDDGDSDIELNQFPVQQIRRSLEDNEDYSASSVHSMDRSNQRSPKRKKTNAPVGTQVQKEMRKGEDKTATDCEKLQALIKSQFAELKRSISYDIRQCFRDMQSNLMLSIAQQNMPNVGNIKEQLIEMPVRNTPDFIQLDDSLLDSEKKNAMHLLIKNWVDGAPTPKKSIHAVLSGVMAKELQLQFSAFGRMTKNVHKLNFSGTRIHCILMDCLATRFEGTPESEIKSALSRWFSGAADRCGGRKERMDN